MSRQNIVDEFINTLSKQIGVRRVPSYNEKRATSVIKRFRDAKKRLVLLDYDGTLAEQAPRPDLAAPSKNMLAALQKLSAKTRTAVAVVSERGQIDLENWLGHLPIYLVAEHGGVVRSPRGKLDISNLDDEWKVTFRPILQKYAREAPGSLVEEKRHSLVWHHGEASPFHAHKSSAILRNILKPYLREHGLTLRVGTHTLEVKRSSQTKRAWAKQFLTTNKFDHIIAIGNGPTDEDMWRALPKRAIKLKVGSGRTIANYRLKDVDAVADLLGSL